MKKGKVNWFDVRKGIGFITGEDGRDAFVHYSEIRTEGFKKLLPGQEVTYDIVEDTKGPKAVNVTPAA